MTHQSAALPLQINPLLRRFIDEEVLPLSSLDAQSFWPDLCALIQDFMPRNKALLEKRDDFQAQLNSWHAQQGTGKVDPIAYRAFLTEIGYLLPQVEDFKIAANNVDREISSVAGPQLVVPLKNARFALNAANARWGSLYDALYGTDVIPASEGREAGASYNPIRGQAVIDYAKHFLDQAAPLESGSHAQATAYAVETGELRIELENGGSSKLADPMQFKGFNGDQAAPSCVLLENHGLHIEIQIDAEGAIGQNDLASVNDIALESAITTIMDCEDSIAAVDSEDKVEVYRNWLGLMQGTLEENFEKGGRKITRRLQPDRNYTSAYNGSISLPGRSLLFIRNVGHLMTSDLVTTAAGEEVPEGILDSVFTSLIAALDLVGVNAQKANSNGIQNSREGSIYIVKPKMHGPEEVAFTCTLYDAVESLLRLPSNTIKLGIMDEERRTSVNLKQCIFAARNRLVFINTGFLDRTGDEIHSSMAAGPFLPKAAIKAEPWIEAYELRNVEIGVQCGLSGRAQIGKGMWAMPDEMAQMMAQKKGHPNSGASTAWVPSPTAATLHAMHYHEIDVWARQSEIAAQTVNPDDRLDALLTIPLLGDPSRLSKQDIQDELENNIQGILGYVVRWVEQGVGCSKVPDINNIGLMEDRATLRISAKHVANWLRYGICSEQQVLDCLQQMAAIVDQQNANDADYLPMSPRLDSSLGFQAAKALIFQSDAQPNGYTEPLLHEFRRRQKRQ